MPKNTHTPHKLNHYGTTNIRIGRKSLFHVSTDLERTVLPTGLFNYQRQENGFRMLTGKAVKI